MPSDFTIKNAVNLIRSVTVPDGENILYEVLVKKRDSIDNKNIELTTIYN